MRKVFLSLLLLMGFSLVTVSCDNGQYDATPSIDKSSIPNPLKPTVSPNGNSVMLAVIDTTHWHSTYAEAKYVNGGFTISGHSGVSANYQNISITITAYKGVGTYPLNTYGNATYTLKNLLTNSTYGQVVIDSDNTGSVVGHFSFQGTGVNITQGVFKVMKADGI